MCHLQSCAKSIKEPSGGSRRSQSHMANTHWLPYRIHTDPKLRISFRNSMRSVDLNNMANTHWLPYRIHSEPKKIVSFGNYFETM